MRNTQELWNTYGTTLFYGANDRFQVIFVIFLSFLSKVGHFWGILHTIVAKYGNLLSKL